MANEFDHIDKFLQQKMDGFQVESSSEDFIKFQKKLSGYRFFRFHWNVFNFYYLLLILGVAIAVICYLLPENQSLIEKNQAIKIQKTPLKNNIQNSTDRKVTNSGLLPSENTETKTSSSQKETMPAVKNQKTTLPNQENNSGFNTKSVVNDTTNIFETGNSQPSDKKIIYDTITTQKKIIVYDTVKTVIVKQMKPEKKKKRRENKR